jgi:hypothetical protein
LSPSRGKSFLHVVQTGIGGGGAPPPPTHTKARPPTAHPPTECPIQWAPANLSPHVNHPVCQADHSPPSSAEVKNTLMCTSPHTPSYRSAQLVEHRDNFTFNTQRFCSLHKVCNCRLIFRYLFVKIWEELPVVEVRAVISVRMLTKSQDELPAVEVRAVVTVRILTKCRDELPAVEGRAIVTVRMLTKSRDELPVVEVRAVVTVPILTLSCTTRCEPE